MIIRDGITNNTQNIKNINLYINSKKNKKNEQTKHASIVNM